jgi:hypothetical protein
LEKTNVCTFAKERFHPLDENEMRQTGEGWEFDVRGTGFEGTFRIEIDLVPEQGEAISLIKMMEIGQL